MIRRKRVSERVNIAITRVDDEGVPRESNRFLNGSVERIVDGATGPEPDSGQSKLGMDGSGVFEGRQGPTQAFVF